jgi:hypothetical protein
MMANAATRSDRLWWLRSGQAGGMPGSRARRPPPDRQGSISCGRFPSAQPGSNGR